MKLDVYPTRRAAEVSNNGDCSGRILFKFLLSLCRFDNLLEICRERTYKLITVTKSLIAKYDELLRQLTIKVERPIPICDVTPHEVRKYSLIRFKLEYLLNGITFRFPNENIARGFVLPFLPSICRNGEAKGRVSDGCSSHL
jgi:hypothetical protein